MIVIPLLYFLLLTIYFYRKHGWGIDVASSLLLVCVSLFAVVTDVKELYGDYGINRAAYNIWTLLLFCVQWTLVLLPLHVLSGLKIEAMDEVKVPAFKLLCLFMFASSVYMVVHSLDDIKDALIMDLADVRDQHYADLNKGAAKGFNPLLLIPTVLTAIPFPTVALVFWFYLNSFFRGSYVVKTCVLLVSIVQAILSITMAGRSAMVYWVFDFYLCYSLFYRFLAPRIRRSLNLVAIVFGTLIVVVFVSITVARFDGTSGDRDPLDSLYGYAGQHINNFSIMMVEGHNAPFLPGREFPFLSRYVLHQRFDLKDHYLELSSHVKALTNVFDTFGAEIYLDLGWLAYVMFMMFLWYTSVWIKTRWERLSFDRIILVAIMIAFFSHGLFSWPFVGQYASMAIAFLLFLVYFFRHPFRI